MIKLHALGDLLIHTPALRRLREGFPDARIELLTTDYAEPVVRHTDLVNELIVVPHSIFFGRSVGSMTGAIDVVSDLWQRGYNHTIVFHRAKPAVWMGMLVSSGETFAYADETSETTVRLSNFRHAAMMGCELADKAIVRLGGYTQPPAELESMRYEWIERSEEIRAAEEFLQTSRLTLGEYYLFFAGGGSNPGHQGQHRRWPSARYSELAQRLYEEESRQTLLLGANRDKDVCAEIRSAAPEAVIDASGVFDLRTSATLARLSAAVVSTDSAPMHVAAAAGAVTLGVFGPTGARTILPPGRNVGSVSQELLCSPCYYTVFTGCLYDRIRCMEELAVENVHSALKQLIRTQKIAA